MLESTRQKQTSHHRQLHQGTPARLGIRESQGKVYIYRELKPPKKHAPATWASGWFSARRSVAVCVLGLNFMADARSSTTNELRASRGGGVGGGEGGVRQVSEARTLTGRSEGRRAADVGRGEVHRGSWRKEADLPRV